MTAAELDAVCVRPKPKRVYRKVHGPVAVDPQDQALAAAYVWGRDPLGYVVRNAFYGMDKPRKKFVLHRVIAEAPVGMVVDHINGDILDNRRVNLRVCTPGQNAKNQGAKGGKVPYKGVIFRKKRYHASINVNMKRYHIGCYATADEAAHAYNAAATQMHGDFARLNVIPLADRLTEAAP